MVFGSVLYAAYDVAAVPELADVTYYVPDNPVAAISSVVEPEEILESAPTPVRLLKPEQRVETTVPVVTAEAVAVGKPVRLEIPNISVDAVVEHLGLTAQGAVQAPAGPRNVSWYNLGSRPGEAGSALISGHSGIWQNATTSVFDRLPELKPGDTVQVTDNQGTVRQFEVQELRVYGKDDSVPELFVTTGEPRLNIITCYGTWLPSLKTYDKRLVVFTKLK